MSTDPHARSIGRPAPRVRSRRLRIVAVAGLIALVAGTAACGDTDDSADNSLPGAIVGTSDVVDSTATTVSPSPSTSAAATTTIAGATATTRVPTGATTTTGGAIAGGGGAPTTTPAGAAPGPSGSGAPAGTAGVGSTPDDSAPVSTTAECEDYQTNVQYPLEKCNTGYVIVLVQSVLKNFGYYDGEISGDFDNATEASLRDYQEAMQLQVDGLVGSQTWNRMLPDLDVKGTDNNGNGVIDPFEVVAG